MAKYRNSKKVSQQQIDERLWAYTRKASKQQPLAPADAPETYGKGVMLQVDEVSKYYYGYVYQQFNLAQKRDMVLTIRDMETYPEVALAIDLMVDTAVKRNLNDNVLELKIKNNQLKQYKNGQYVQFISEEWEEFFHNVYGGEEALRFNFRRWLVDGQLWLENVPSPQGGYLIVKHLPCETMILLMDQEKQGIKNYYQILDPGMSVYGQYGLMNKSPDLKNDKIVVFEPHEITYIDSGLYGQGGLIDPRSRLEVAVKTYKQLKLIEDAMVIYRVTRAPERRIFNVDVGNMPKGQAEQYLKNLISQYRNKKVYDPSTGTVSDAYNPIAMTEDFWVPNRGGQASVKIDTLQGGANLDQIKDVEYFLKKIYRALKVPKHLLENEGGGSMGGPGGTDTKFEDQRFATHVEQLQNNFVKHIVALFLNHLKLMQVAPEFELLTTRDLTLLMTAPSNFKDKLDIETQTARIQLVSAYLATGLFPAAWILKHVAKITEEELNELQHNIADEMTMAQEFGIQDPTIMVRAMVNASTFVQGKK